MEQPRVDFIGLGARKAATTWLYQCLREHPEIQMSESKEINYFGRDELFEKGDEWYFRHFDVCPQNKIQGEFSTHYLIHPDAPKRIFDLMPNIKCIAVLRNPIDRAQSHLEHSRGKERYQNMNVIEAIKSSQHMLGHGLYGAALERYYQLFPKENILVVWYDDLKKDPKTFLQTIYRFLNVDEKFTPTLISKKYHSAGIHTSFIYRTLNKIYLTLHTYRAGKMLIKIFQTLGIRSALLHQLLSKKKKEKLSPKERKALYLMYQEDIEKT